MFGSHKNDDNTTEDPQDNSGFVSAAHPDPTGVPEPPAPGAFDATTPSDESTTTAPTTDSAVSDTSSAEPATETTDSSTNTPQFGQPFTPGSILPAADESTGSDSDVSPAVTESSDNPSGSTDTTSSEPASVSSTSDTPATSDLIELKKEALQNLTPLVDHLDQTPEERFKTTMMMIQASDDQSLIQRAYDAANQITDDSAKAQALLDIVNEINYFTQQQS